MTASTAKLKAAGLVAICGVYGAVWCSLAENNLVWALPIVAVFAMGRFGRFTTYLAYLAFYSAGTFPLTIAAERIPGQSPLTTYALWCMLATICALPSLMLRSKHRGLMAVIVYVLWLLPPVGYIAPNNPAILTGLFFPAIGPASLLLMATLIYGIAEYGRSPRGNYCLYASASIAIAANFLWSASSLPSPKWRPLDTAYGNNGESLQSRLDTGNIKGPKQLGKALEQSGADVVFVGEGILYDVSPFTEDQWNSANRPDSVTLVGYYKEDAQRMTMASTAIAFGNSSQADEINRQLREVRSSSPFPITMWHPWNKFEHFPLGLPNAPIRIQGLTTHLIWCYEGTIVWPHLRALFERPVVAVSLENRWMTADTSLESAQSVATRLNARLLGAVLLQATNR